MPAAVTHNIFAEKVLINLKENMQIVINEDAYYFGAQGPDFLFMHRFLPWMRGESISEYGHKVHMAKPSQVLKIMKEFAKSEDGNRAYSYFLGFICHYSLDSVCHPYVNFVAEELLEDEPEQSKNVFHGECEAALDAIVYRVVKGGVAANIKMKEYYSCDKENEEMIIKLYKTLFKELFSDEINTEILKQVMKDAKKVFGKLSDSTGIKKWILSVVEKGKERNISSHFIPEIEKGDFDYANFSKSEWKDYKANVRSESFLELMDMAEKKATDIICGLSSNKIEDICDDEPFC